MRESKGEKTIGIINMAVLILISLACILPFINIFAMSLSSNASIVSGKVVFLPVEFTLDMYNKVLSDVTMITSIKFTTILTVIYTFCALFCTIILAYPLSRKTLRGRKPIMIFVVFTMYFSGGIIPSFLVVKNLNLLNSIWALILPCLINTYFFIIMRSFFMNIPESLIESALLDGANEIQILFKIILPLSAPVIASIALFYAVQRWNGLQDAVFYINSPSKYPLQLKLREMILSSVINEDPSSVKEVFALEGMKSATLIIATLPILIVYPLLQKYFVTGMTLGAVKG